MKRLTAAVLLLFVMSASLMAQEKKEEKKPESHWKKGIVATLGFSQLSLTNWAAGGSGQLSLNTLADLYANYTKGKCIWNSELQAGYGFIESYETGFRKSDDRLVLDSKFGYKAVEKLYISAVFNFRSQFAKGYKSETDKTLVSDLLAPANTSLGLGIDYTPTKSISINVAPLTGKVVMVRVPELREKYGNAVDQFARFELGAQIKIDGRIDVENFKVNSSLILFSDYLKNPQNIKVNWDTTVTAKISKHFSFTLLTNLIYDDNVKLNKKNRKTGEEYQAAGVQFKELFTIGFSYTIGQSK